MICNLKKNTCFLNENFSNLCFYHFSWILEKFFSFSKRSEPYSSLRNIVQEGRNPKLLSGLVSKGKLLSPLSVSKMRPLFVK